MNHNIRTEYHIDKLSDLGYSSGESNNKIVYNKKKSKISYRNIKRSVNKSSSDSTSDNISTSASTSTSSSSSVSSSEEPLFTVYGSDYSQYNEFSNSWNQYLSKFNSHYPLIMRYLLNIDKNCSDSNGSNNCSGNKVKTIKSIGQIKPNKPIKSQIFNQISNKQNEDLYLRDIIKTYNDMQNQYADLFNNIRNILIEAGYSEYNDTKYIVKPIIIKYTHIPKPTDDFFDFMRKLKADINQIVQTIEQLYEWIGIKNADTIQIREFYNNIRLKQVPLVPMDKTKYPETELNKKLSDIFNLLGGRNNKNKYMRGGGRNNKNKYMRGGGPLDNTDEMITTLRKRLEAYKSIMQPLDISSIQRLDKAKRLMLMTGEEKKYEDIKSKDFKSDGIKPKIPLNIEETDISLDKFDTYDKNYLVDTILNNTGLDSASIFDFNPDIETYDLKKIIDRLKPLYNNFSQQIKKEELEPIIKDMEKFINYNFGDLKEDSFTFITKDEFEFKENIEKNALIESPIKKLQTQIDISKINLNNLFLIIKLPELINLITNIDILLLEKGKDINDYKTKTLGDIYNDIKPSTDSITLNDDINNIKTGFDKIYDIVIKFYPSSTIITNKKPYSRGTDELQTYAKNFRIRKLIDPFRNHNAKEKGKNIGKEDTYFFLLYEDSTNKTSDKKPTSLFLETFHALYNFMNKNIVLMYNPDTKIKDTERGYRDEKYNFIRDIRELNKDITKLKKDITKLKKIDEKIRSDESAKSGTELGSGIFPGKIEHADVSSEFIDYQKLFKNYIQSYEKLLDQYSSNEQIKNLDSILDKRYSIDPSLTGQLKELDISDNIIRPFLDKIRLDDKIINNIITSRDIKKTDARVETLKQNINKQYEDNNIEYIGLLGKMKLELSKPDSVVYDPINKELELINADREQLKLEVMGLLDLLKVVDDYDVKVKTFDSSLSDSYAQIKKNAKSKYNILFDSEDTESNKILYTKKGGTKITDKFNQKIDDNELNSSQIINNIYEKIMYIENIKKGVGDTEKILKYGFELVSDIQGIILFTFNVLQKIVTMCDSSSAICKIKMIKYIEYDNLVEFKNTLELVINNKSLMTNCQNKAIKGPIIRINNFLKRLIDIVASKASKPSYIMIDINKKSFIPLIITQSLIFYTFDGKSMIKCI